MEEANRVQKTHQSAKSVEKRAPGLPIMPGSPTRYTEGKSSDSKRLKPQPGQSPSKSPNRKPPPTGTRDADVALTLATSGGFVAAGHKRNRSTPVAPVAAQGALPSAGRREQMNEISSLIKDIQQLTAQKPKATTASRESKKRRRNRRRTSGRTEKELEDGEEEGDYDDISDEEEEQQLKDNISVREAEQYLSEISTGGGEGGGGKLPTLSPSSRCSTPLLSQQLASNTRVQYLYRELFYETNSDQPREHLDLSHWMPYLSNENVLKDASRYFSPLTKSVDLSGTPATISADAIATFLASNPNLNALQLSKSPAVTSQLFQKVADSCPHLERIDLSGCLNINEKTIKALCISSLSTTLREINLSDCQGLTPTCISILTTKLAPGALRALNLSSCPSLREREVISLISANAQTLAEFTASNSGWVTDNLLEMLVQCRKLRSVDLSSCDKITDDGTRNFFETGTVYGSKQHKRCMSWETLKLADCPKLTGITLSWISAGCYSLKYLDISGCDLDDNGLRALQSCRNITHLFMARCEDITDLGLKAFSEFTTDISTGEAEVKQLEVVSLSQCRRVTGAGIMSLLPHMRKVEELFLNEIGPLSSQHFAELCQSVPSLKRLEIQKNSCINATTASMIVKRWRKTLTYLNVSQCPGLSDSALHALHPLAVLQSLNVSACGKLSPHALKILPLSLQELICQNFPKLTDEDVSKLPSNENLRRLDLSGCSLLTPLCLQLIKTDLPNIEEVNVFGCEKICGIAPASSSSSVSGDNSALYDLCEYRRQRQKRQVYVYIVEEERYFGLRLRTSCQIHVDETEFIVKRHKAAILIQTIFRAKLKARRDYIRRKRMEKRTINAVMTIVRSVRRYLYRKRQRAAQRRLHAMVYTLQHKWQYQRARKLRERAQKFRVTCLLLRCLTLWKEFAYEQVQARGMTLVKELEHRAQAFWRLTHAKKHFRAIWRHVQQKKLRNRQATKFWKNRHFPPMLAAWHVAAQQRDIDRREFFRRYFLLVVPVDYWNSARQHREYVSKALRLQTRFLLRHWHRNVKAIKTELVTTALSLSSKSLLTWGFRVMKRYTLQKREEKQKCARVLHKITHRELYVAWSSWKTFHDGKRRIKKALAFFTRSTERRLFSEWIHKVESKKERHQQIIDAAKHHRRHHCRYSISTWRGWSRVQAEYKRRLRRAFAMLNSRTMLLTFSGWKGYIQHHSSMVTQYRAKVAVQNQKAVILEWKGFAQRRRVMRRAATMIQALWRGTLARYVAENYYYSVTWASVVIQAAWRMHAARKERIKAERRILLREFLRAEAETEAMGREENHMRKFLIDLQSVVIIQTVWRRKLARRVFFKRLEELRLARIEEAKAARKKIIEDMEARKRRLAEMEKLKDVAIIEIQRVARGYLGRKIAKTKREDYFIYQCAAMLQAAYRGRISRRDVAAMRRHKENMAHTLARRREEARVLRAFGATTRAQQNVWRHALGSIGAEPHTFQLNPRKLLSDILQDMRGFISWMQEERDVLFVRDIEGLTPESDGSDSEDDSPMSELEAQKKKHSQQGKGVVEGDPKHKIQREGEAITNATPKSGIAVKQEIVTLKPKKSASTNSSGIFRDLFRSMFSIGKREAIREHWKAKRDAIIGIQPYMAVKVIILGHPREGETGYVLRIDRSSEPEIAEIKMDTDGVIEFLPLKFDDTEERHFNSNPYTMIPVEKKYFSAVEKAKVQGSKTGEFRTAIMEYARKMRKERRDSKAATIIQRSFRVTMARIRMARERQHHALALSRRQAILVAVLSKLSLLNLRTARLLCELNYIQENQLPLQISQEPLAIEAVYDRFMRFIGRQTELNGMAVLQSLHGETYQGEGERHGEVMPATHLTVFHRLVEEISIRIRKSSTPRLAQRHAARGRLDVSQHILEQQLLSVGPAVQAPAAPVGVTAKRRTALPKIYIGSFRFPQLLHSPYTLSDGWAVFHGEYYRGRPHGWGVAKFLLGLGLSRHTIWAERGSIYSKYRRLGKQREQQLKEQENRLGLQLLLHHSKYVQRREKEGPVGFATRHSLLSKNEEEMKATLPVLLELREKDTREMEQLWEEEEVILQRRREAAKDSHEKAKAVGLLRCEQPSVVADLKSHPTMCNPFSKVIVGSRIELQWEDKNWYSAVIVRLLPGNRMQVRYEENEVLEVVFVCPSGAKTFAEDGEGGDDSDIAALLSDGKKAQEGEEKEVGADEDTEEAEKKKKKPLKTIIRAWRAYAAVDLQWTAPDPRGDPVKSYLISWKSDLDPLDVGELLLSASVTAKAFQEQQEMELDLEERLNEGKRRKKKGNPKRKGGKAAERDSDDSDSENDEVREEELRIGNKATIWPLHIESTYSFCIQAINTVGYSDLSPSLAGIKSETLHSDTAKPPDSAIADRKKAKEEKRRERRERKKKAELELKKRTCAICRLILPYEEDVYPHIEDCHGIAWVCPFVYCQAPCSSRKALLYHLQFSTDTLLNGFELEDAELKRILKMSQQYCKLKRCRHLPSSQPLTDYEDDTPAGKVLDKKTLQEMQTRMESAFYESRLVQADGPARQAAIERQSQALERKAKLEDRERRLKPPPLPPVYGVKYTSEAAVRQDIEETQQRLERSKEELKLLAQQFEKEYTECKAEIQVLELKITKQKEKIAKSTESWEKERFTRERKKDSKALTEVKEKLSQKETEYQQRKQQLENLIVSLEKQSLALGELLISVRKLILAQLAVHETTTKVEERAVSNSMGINVVQSKFEALIISSRHEVDALMRWNADDLMKKKYVQKLHNRLELLQLAHKAEMHRLITEMDQEDRQEIEAIEFLIEQANIKKGKGGGGDDEGGGKKNGAQRRRKGPGDVVRIKSKEELEEEQKKEMEALLAESKEEQEKTETDKEGGEEDLEEGEANGEQGNKATDGGRRQSSLVDLSRARGTRNPKVLMDPLANAYFMVNGEDTVPRHYSRIEGEFFSGFISGHVKIEYTDKSTYIGPWSDDASYIDRAEGGFHCSEHRATWQSREAAWGRWTTSVGVVWEGPSVNNHFDPEKAYGRIIRRDSGAGSEYDGDFELGKENGFGTLSFRAYPRTGEYVGEWRDGLRHGFGVQLMSDGERYEGDWMSGERHGSGKMVFPDGSYYEGDFRSGRWSGLGKRVCANGDKYLGRFLSGEMHGEGEFHYSEDGSIYNGTFVHDNRQGKGVLRFADGTRYEGSFFDDQFHGEAKWITRAAVGSSSSQFEIHERLGLWENGVLKQWLSYPLSELSTMTFVEKFGEVRTTALRGKFELAVRPEVFGTAFSIMVAQQLPELPTGVDPRNVFVKAIIKEIARAERDVVGVTAAKRIAQRLQRASEHADEAIRADRELKQQVVGTEEMFAQSKEEAVKLHTQLHGLVHEERTCQGDLAIFWSKEPRNCLQTYNAAVKGLEEIDSVHWKKLKELDVFPPVLTDLLRAMCLLLNITKEVYMVKLPHVPTVKEMRMIIGNSKESVDMGDMEGLIHHYKVKAIYLIPLFNPYSFSTGLRRQLLDMVAPVVYNPRIRPNNLTLAKISMAVPACCAWVRAAYYYAMAACQIASVYRRIETIQTEIPMVQPLFSEAKKRAEELATELESLKRRSTEVQETMAKAVEAQKKLEDMMEQTSSLQKSDPNEAVTVIYLEDDDKNRFEQQRYDSEYQQIENEKEKTRQDRLQLAMQQKDIWMILRTNVKVVLRHCEGNRIPLSDFPTVYREIFMAPLSVQEYGFKRLKDLLEKVSDTCQIEIDEGNHCEYVVLVEKSQLKKFSCDHCPGLEYPSLDALYQHLRTKWHSHNRQRESDGQEPLPYRAEASKRWREDFDSNLDVIFVNDLTKETEKQKPLEMEMDEIDFNTPASQVEEELFAIQHKSQREEEGVDEVGKEILKDSEGTAVQEGEEAQIPDSQAEGGAAQAFFTTDPEAEYDSNPHSAQTAGNVEDWIEVKDEGDGQVYYYNSKTGESAWTLPNFEDTWTDLEAPSELPVDIGMEAGQSSRISTETEMNKGEEAT